MIHTCGAKQDVRLHEHLVFLQAVPFVWARLCPLLPDSPPGAGMKMASGTDIPATRLASSSYGVDICRSSLVSCGPWQACCHLQE